MKLLADFNQEELAAITPEQKQQVFLLECAERGIALPASVPEYMASPDDREDLRPDITLYKIAGRYSSDGHFFNTLEEAQAVVDLIARTSVTTGSEYRSRGENLIYLSDKESRDIEVTPVPAYSKDKYNQLKDELKKYDDQKSIVDRNNARRDEILNKHSALMSEIESAIEEAERNVNRVREFAGMLQQYLEMANNDHAVATRFLLNAHYDEISGYGEEQLATIGITKDNLTTYIEASKTQE